MKNILKELINEDFRLFQIWSYLWLKSNDNNEYSFNYVDVCVALKIQKPVMSRAIKYIDTINAEKEYITLSKEGHTFTVKFYDRGKPKKKLIPEVEKEAMNVLISFYEKIDFEYPEVKRHAIQVKSLLNKISTFIQNREGKDFQITDEYLIQTLGVFLNNIPKWWIDNGHIKLSMLIRKYAQIIQQIKSKNKGNYGSRVNETKSRDFSKFVKK